MNKRQFIMIEHIMLEDKKISANDGKVHMCLMKYYNEKIGYAYPSLETISQCINLSVSTVKRSLKKLERLGYVIIEKRKGMAGNHNIYKNLKYYIYSRKNASKKVEATEEVAVDVVVGSEVKEEVVAIDPKQSKIDNNQNVRLARAVVNVDKSKFAKTVLSLANEELVREAINSFKKKNGKSASFLIDLLVDEYCKAGVRFSNALFNLLKSGLKNTVIMQPV